MNKQYLEALEKEFEKLFVTNGTYVEGYRGLARTAQDKPTVYSTPENMLNWIKSKVQESYEMGRSVNVKKFEEILPLYRDASLEVKASEGAQRTAERRGYNEAVREIRDAFAKLNVIHVTPDTKEWGQVKQEAEETRHGACPNCKPDAKPTVTQKPSEWINEHKNVVTHGTDVHKLGLYGLDNSNRLIASILDYLDKLHSEGKI